MRQGRPAPASGLLRRIDALGRGILPVGLFGLVPAVALSSVFFWSVCRPAALPPPAVFGLGLLQDLLTAAPPGSGMLVLLVVHGLSTRWRRRMAAQGFLLVWLAFCGVSAGAAALGEALQVLLAWHALPIPPGLWQAVLTAGLYPLLAWPLTRVHEAMLRAESAP